MTLTNTKKSKGRDALLLRKERYCIMRKKVLTAILTVVMASAAIAGCSSAPEETEVQAKTTGAETKKSEETTSAGENEEKDTTKNNMLAAQTGDIAKMGDGKGQKVVLITIDSMDQHWVNMDKGCKLAAEELGCEYKWIAPDVKDDAKQIECVNNAVADGATALLVAANGPDAITAALQEADEAGVKIVQVDSFANYPCVQKLGTDNRAAGKMAGEMVLKELEAKGIKEGKIGIVSVNAATTSTVDRDEGFRSAFEGTAYENLETQYADGDAAKSKDAAANFISQGCVALFGANEGSCVGVGNAVAEDGNNIIAAGMDKSDAVIQLIKDGALICTMAQNPDIMGYEGMYAAITAINGGTVAPEYIDTGVSALTVDKVQ